MQGSRLGWAAIACAVGVLGGAAPAWAGTVRSVGNEVRFDAGAGEVNQVTVRFVFGAPGLPAGFEFRDATSPVAAGSPGCVAVDAGAVRCPAEGVEQIVVALGDGNDTALNSTSMLSRMSGGEGDDVLTGGRGTDVLDGEGGNDRLIGRTGDDVLNGGSGNDALDGQHGVDLINGGDGDDRMFDQISPGGADNPDRYTCGAGTDRVDADIADVVATDCEQVTRPVAGPGGLVPGPVAPDPGPAPGPCGTDVLGTAGPDMLRGDGGRDRIFGLLGDDDIRGAGGADCLHGGEDDDVVSGQRGADVVSGGAGDDRLAGGSGRDRLSGGAGDDVIRVGRGRNVARGGAGDDVVRSVNGRRDVIRCGRGSDRVRADRSDRVRGCETVRRAG